MDDSGDLRSSIKKWNIIYPVYINSKKTVAEGRRIAAGKACPDPTCIEIADSCSYLKIPYAIEADIDNSGTIDYGEFIAATLHMNKLEREENLVSAFSFFDKDGSGFITIDELSQACQEFGLDDVHLEDMIKDADQNNDGQIDYSEFAAMMT